MTGEGNRIRRINTSQSDEEKRSEFRKSQNYHANFIDAIRLELEDEMVIVF